MTAAIIGLVGVFIGGVLNGVVGWRLEGARQHRAARAAARLVRAELADLVSESEFVCKVANTWRDIAWESGEWDSHRALLAETLRANEFDAVSAAYVDAGHWRRIASRAGDPEMDNQQRDLLGMSVEGFKRAILVLSPAAADPLPWRSRLRP